jgi:hypothetical protein
MSQRDSFIFYRSFYEAITELDDAQKGRVYDAVFKYGLNGESSDLNGVEKAIFTLIKPQLDANQRRYENGRKGAEYGKLGGRPPKGKNPKETPRKPLKNPKETPNDNVNGNVNGNVNVNKNVNVNQNEKINTHGLSGDLFDEFKSMRKKKRKAITQRVMDGINREARSIGWSMDKAITEVLENDWQSFKAEYIHKDRHRAPKPQGSLTHEEFQKTIIDGQLENLK